VTVTVSARLGVPDADHSELGVDRSTQVVGQVVVATVTIRDVYDKALPGVTVTFGVDESASIQVRARTGAATCQTGPDGTCRMNVTDKVTETVQVSATIQVAGVPVAVRHSPRTVTFTAGCLPGIDAGCTYDDAVDNDHRSQVKVTTDNQRASAATPDVARVLLFDLYGNAVDRTVTSTALDAALVIGAITRTGPGVHTIAYTTADTSGVTLQAAVMVDGVPVTFIPQPGSAPASAPADIAALSSPAVLHFVDTLAPPAPVIAGPADGTLTRDPLVAVTGTGEPDAAVLVSDQDGNLICRATVSGGAWSCQASLPDGEYGVRAVQTDRAGNTSPASPAVRVRVDTLAPAAPVITGPADGALVNASPLVSGTGETGARVVVADEGGHTVCSATVTDGAWSCPSHLADGDHALTAVQTDPAGNVSPSSHPVNVSVDTLVPAAPVITGPADGALLTASPLVSGTGETGARVVVTDEGGHTVCSATVTDGAWSCPSHLADGDHALTAVQTDPAGNVSPSSHPVNVSVDTLVPAAPVITGPAEGTLTNSSAVVVAGTGEPRASVVVSDRDGKRVCAGVVTAGGSWTCQAALGDGAYALTAVQTDPAGNVSPASRPVTVGVDTMAPGAPRVDVLDGTQASGGPGAAEPGATVAVTWPDGSVGRATAGADGSWSVPAPSRIGAGTVPVTATDAAGNTSPTTSASLVFALVPTGGVAAGGERGLVALAAGLLLASGLVVGVGRRHLGVSRG